MNKTNTNRINENIEHNQWNNTKSKQNQEQIESLVITTTKEGVQKTNITIEERENNQIKIKLKWIHINPYWHLTKQVKHIIKQIEDHNNMKNIIIIGLFEQLIRTSPGIYKTKRIIRKTKQIMKQVSERTPTTQKVIIAEQLFTISTVHKRDIIYAINKQIKKRNQKLEIPPCMPWKAIQKIEKHWQYTQQRKIYRKVDIKSFDGNGELRSHARENLANYMLNYMANTIRKKQALTSKDTQIITKDKK